MDIPLLLLALLGHTLLWVAMINRAHAVAIPQSIGHLVTATCMACLVSVPIGFAWWYVSAGARDLPWHRFPPQVLLYLGICWVAATVMIARRAWQGVSHRPPPVLRSHRTRIVELTIADPPGVEQQAQHFLVRLPGNQILQLDLTERAFDVPRLDPVLDGLSIVHLSDFHFTGRVAKWYFEEAVRHSNELQPDLVAITGDLVDHSDYIDWVPDTLGKLTARYGIYFILGNHDIRIDTRRLRRVLDQCGLIDLGGRWIEVRVRGRRVVLAGNELPWLAPAADMTRCPPRHEGQGPLRIVLSHSPDQFDWSRAQDADLLLAGHTHGGQIRVPWIGAIFSPSAVGVKYASGVFYAHPTIMHVTRGISGELPVRLNCPPEMAHLRLHAPRRE